MINALTDNELRRLREGIARKNVVGDDSIRLSMEFIQALVLRLKQAEERIEELKTQVELASYVNTF